ncbi:hypothetical protein CI102_14988 [Trichoderma harzianum]|uniref:Uncharacterized protein n=1 Tax=Trichoderma harzianum CBS 226.95 TaxID=983964 RepID=A0A2T4A5V1_TRIHA|nr:hypothetical protein M431DRAFT_217916 [Trichoderma harzianum CBS 226.95]PKK40334.1 hypothetical protein CI102_14988 [Trichoderma harzianum]PTB52447.1 hypothetical protein M431DRAFT_217916 [Trichoderma harzianum CBS 226.95]
MHGIKNCITSIDHRHYTTKKPHTYGYHTLYLFLHHLILAVFFAFLVRTWLGSNTSGRTSFSDFFFFAWNIQHAKN